MGMGQKELGGVENSGAPAALFWGILFTGESLRPAYSGCGPCTRPGLQAFCCLSPAHLGQRLKVGI